MSKPGNLRAWFLAARPKTLAGAAAPVCIGGAAAWHDGRADDQPLSLIPFILCVVFAIVMQIDANFINDYFDYKKGSDREDRLGPERACAQGWISPQSMWRGIITTTLVAAFTGLPLIYYGSWWLVAVGAACIIFCFLYTTHLSYLGWGDVLVIVFFGLVPVCATYYVLTGALSAVVVLASLGCGFATDCLLMVNNYRDRHEDRKSGKRTLVVRFGDAMGRHLYQVVGWVAILIGILTTLLIGQPLKALLLIVYTLMHLRANKDMMTLDGKPLNAVLGKTATNILVYALTLSLMFLL